MRRFRNALDHPGILNREEALRDEVVEYESDRQRQHGDDQCERLAVQHPIECAAVDRNDRVERSFSVNVEGGALRLRVMTDQLGAHHRHERQGDDRRNDDGHGERDGEFVEQSADHVAHEQKWDEYREQRDRQRNDGEADLPRALKCRLDRLHAVFDVARDVLDHHDGVVDHKPGGDGQRHQRKVVEAETQQIHHAKRTDER